MTMNCLCWRCNWLPLCKREGSPGEASGKEPTCRRHKRRGFNSLIRKIPWSRAWPPTSVFLPDRGAWWATVYRVTNSWTQLKWLSTHVKEMIPNITSYFLQKLCSHLLVISFQRSWFLLYVFVLWILLWKGFNFLLFPSLIIELNKTFDLYVFIYLKNHDFALFLSIFY